MRKQLIAYLLQAAGSLAAVTAGFVAHPIAGWAVLAVVATVHGVALEVEHSATHDAPVTERAAGMSPPPPPDPGMTEKVTRVERKREKRGEG